MSKPLQPVDAPPEHWLDQACRQLEAIQQLPDGWDSHGGRRPDVSTIKSGCALIRALANADRELSKPHIHPTPSGGVQLHWESDARYFEVELIDSLTVQYYFLDRDEQVESEGRLSIGEAIETVVDYARRAAA